jgi:hypothetical protein
MDYFGDLWMHVAKSLWGILAKFKVQNAKFKVISDLGNVGLQERIAFMGEAYDSVQAIERGNKCTVCVNQSYYHICGINYRRRSCTSRADYSHQCAGNR